MRSGAKLKGCPQFPRCPGVTLLTWQRQQQMMRDFMHDEFVQQAGTADYVGVISDDRSPPHAASPLNKTTISQLHSS